MNVMQRIHYIGKIENRKCRLFKGKRRK